jgi:hypothetical protein
MKRLITLVPLFLSFFLPNCFAEQKIVQATYVERCDAPTWNIGDYWKFQYNHNKWWSQKVISVEGDLYTVENEEDRCTYGYDTNTLQLKIHTDIVKKRLIFHWDPGIFYDFPLYMGKKWTKTGLRSVWGRPESSYLQEFEVISAEDVTVPVGTFKAFKIEYTLWAFWRQRNLLKDSSIRMDNYVKYDVWYSPEVKNIVRYCYVEKKGVWEKIEQNYELVAYRLMD